MTNLRTVLFSVFALSCVARLEAMQSIHDVPDYYANLTAYGDEQDYQIIQILSKNFPYFNKNKYKLIVDFSININESNFAQLETDSLKELIDTHKSMIQSLQINWLPVEDYRLHPKEFYNNWTLLYKYGGLLDNESQLVIALAQKFGFDQSVVYCKNFPDAKYLYVKNEIVDRFKRVFAFSNFKEA